MSPEAQRVAIAESLGWTRVHFSEDHRAPNDWYGEPPNETYYRFPSDKGRACIKLPRFYSDLNACAEFERALTNGQHKAFRIELWKITTGGENDGYEEVSSALRRAFVSATAPQRCEAYLRAIGLWTEGE